MTRTSIFSSAVIALMLTLGAGCEDKAADSQRKAHEAQAEADKKIAEANRESTTRTTGAQMEADKKIAAAQSDFDKRREDYRHKTQGDLVDLDKKIDVLEAKAKAATGKAKTDLDGKLARIRAHRLAFGQSFASVHTATASQWDDLKARTDQEWTDLRKMVDEAD